MRNSGVRWWLMAITVALFVSQVGNAQTFILKPAELRDTEGNFNVKLLLKTDEIFRLNWTQLDQSELNLSGSNSKLVIGRISNTYDVLEVDVTGNRGEFIPDNIGLSPGRYYARITNSEARTATTIAADFDENPESILYSNEIFLIVEANEAPTIIAPRGTINNSTPTFQWTAVSGVPSYWLILSSTPFDIVEDDDGNISIEGATIVWQYITKDNTTNYGDINYDSPFTDDALPLNSGQEYSYTVLNVYEDNNPAFTSPVFGGIIPFIYEDPNAVPPTNLVSPANNESFFAEETITFEWEDIPQATNYTVILSQIVRQQGIDVTVPIWSSTTTNNLIEYPALDNLKNGRYEWNVISNNSSGGGTTSDKRNFNYEIPTGEFIARIKSSSDNSAILGVELTARSISGGVTPSLPYFVGESSYQDSLVAGTYEFTAKKDGYETGNITQTINADRTRNLDILLTSLPSSFSGTVIDENSDAVENAIIVVSSLSSEFQENTVTDGNGNFVISVDEGSYDVNVSKSGYISPENQTITLGLNEQETLGENFILTNDEASVSGFVYNDDGDAIQRAKVTISKGDESYEVNSNGSGAYQFTVSSGTWVISSEKTGFVKPANQSISLSTGDVLQNQDFILTGNANQVTGFVRERIVNEDGSAGTASFENIEVQAVPSVGEVISTISGRGGQYTLSLKSGSYSIVAVEDNYTANTNQELVIGIAVGETISGIDFELIPNPSQISGTVTLPDGNGVIDASVQVSGVGTVTTSGSGFYQISVPEGEHTISVVKNGLVSPDPRNVTVSVGQELTGVEFQMTPNAGTVSGKISSGGESISNTKLTAINNNGTKREITNNLDGSYSFNLSSGSWYIKATKAGFISDSTEVISIGPGQQIVNQNLSLVENLTTIRGTVISSGSALRNATILITKPNNSTFEQSTLSQVNGTYAVTLPAGEVYTLKASKDGFRATNITTDELVAGATVANDFELSANPSSVSGIVNVSGAGILKNATIAAFDTNGNLIETVNSDNDGEYLLGLDPDNYELTVSKAGYTTTESSTVLNIGQNLTGVNFTIDENFAFISGTITDFEGNAVEQVFINLQKINGRGASTVTDQNGNFNINGLTAGDFSIELSKSGFITETETFSLNDGDFLEFDKTLVSKSGSLTGLITDENGIQLEDATVTATNTDGVEYVAITNSVGIYTINSVEPSEYEVNASKTGYTSDQPTLATITIDNLNISDVNVSNLIPNNGVIQGVITDVVTGDPIKDVQVSANGTRGSGFTLTSANGQFEITNLIPAAYNLISTKAGFSSNTISIEIDPLNPTLVSNRTLLQNNGTLSGLITDLSNNPLPFLVTVIASNEDEVRTTKTNAVGEFAFEEIETGTTYKIETDIYREGYINTASEIDVPLGVSEVIVPEALEVEVNKGSISGSAGISGASIKLIDGETGEIIELASSNSNNEYLFDFLPTGSYRLAPSRLGYIFNPDTTGIINVSADGSVSQDFSAQANIGTISVLVRNSSNNPLSNTDVSIVSADTTVILSKKTNAEGVALFDEIEAGTEYTIRASRSGFTTNPEFETVSLSSGNTSNVTFEMLENSSSISGIVNFDNNGTVSNLRDVNLSATLVSTGQKFETSSTNSGAYSFSNLASGEYTIIATRNGFTRDTVSVELSPGQEITAENLVLERASVEVRGFVQFKGSGVSGINVTAQSSASFDVETREDGRYRFATLPLKTGANDTTVYQFNITSGIFSSSVTRKFTRENIGKRVELPTTFLPSGQIKLLVSDGVEPLEGASLQFGISGGESNQIVTGSTGAFESDDNLRKATYVVSVAKEGYLVPQNTVRYVLPSDTTVLDTTVVIPYRQMRVNEILADAPTLVSVINTNGYDNTRTSAQLFYKKASQNQFISLNMARAGDTLRAEIPILNSTEEVTFYTSVIDTSAGNIFTSSQRSIVPLASGILTNVRISPTLTGQTLRIGETYNLELLVRDGINKSLVEEFEEGANGAVSWANLSDSTGLEIIQISGTEIQLNVLKSGSYTLRATASLQGSNVNTSANFTASDVPLENIVVNAPSKQLANSSSHVFSYAAFDTSGNSVLLGQSLNWEIEPAVYGTIDNRGQFTPSNNSLLGSFRITAQDNLTGISGSSDEVGLIASIRPDAAYAFNNGEGFELSLPIGSVDFPSQISLTETNPPPSKKFVFAQGSDQSYTVGDRIYVLAFSGSSLKNTAQLTMPTDSTISELNSGEREVGRFNYTTLQWEIFESLTSKSRASINVGTIETERLGQFAVLAQNTPLGISNAAVLPSPFSPDIAPVKIGYWLDTAFPPAKVTIKIYNIRGELVRTLLEDDLQQPGRYGSSSSTQEITWDGLTDAGNMARNGRYVVQITAKDAQTEEVKLLQVILIK